MLTMTVTRVDGSNESQVAPKEAVALWAQFPLVRTAWHTKPERLVLRRDSTGRGLVVEYCWADGGLVPFWVNNPPCGGQCPLFVGVDRQPEPRERDKGLVGGRRQAYRLMRGLWALAARNAEASTLRVVIADAPPRA